MKRSPKIGEAAELSFVVTEQHVIDFADDQMPAVLCTPWLIWFLEHAARETMLPLLDADESTVGLQVDVEHLAPTPLGHKVTCTAPAKIRKSENPTMLSPSKSPSTQNT